MRRTAITAPPPTGPATSAAAAPERTDVVFPDVYTPEQVAGWRWRVAIAIVPVAAAALFVSALLRVGPGDGVSDTFSAVGSVTFTITGAIILGFRPGNRVGWLALAIGVAASAATISAVLGERGVAGWLRQWTPAVSFGLLGLLLLYFPDGRPPTARWRVASAVLSTALVLAAGGLAVAALDHPTVVTNPSADRLSTVGEQALRVGVAGVVALAVGMVLAVVGVAARWRRASPDIRRQLRWLAFAAAAVPFAVWVDAAALSGGAVILAVSTPTAVAIAVVGHRLYDIDLWLNRTALYIGLSAVLLVAYVSVVVTAEALVDDPDGRWPAIMAAGLVAVAFEPLRRRALRHADRLLYGDRERPYAVVSALARELEAAAQPAEVLPRLVETVSRSLRLSYAAVELTDTDPPLLVAAYGRLVTSPVSFPMVYQGRQIGRLLVGPRTVGQAFSREEANLLADVARQAGVAAEAVRLTAALQRSREQLVRAQEDERRRLRRDLHDGLGPALSGIAMQVGVVRSVGDPGGGILPVVEGQLQECIDDIRRIVEGLRPPLLDAHGLVDGLRRQLDAFGGGPRFVVRAVVPTVLPAAVEVTAFRIAAEACANVFRHADARWCEVLFEAVDGGLLVQIDDDGRGVCEDHRAGVGILSMRERAAELGGRCAVLPRPGGGTRVRAELPMGDP